MRRYLNRVAICSLLIVCYDALADKVHVYQRTSAGGEVKQLSDAMLDTGLTYTTVAAPSITGYIFTHWSIDKNQEFKNRDVWGRALDAASYLLLEQLTLTANYLPATLDQDGDGVADGYEIYWYGDILKNAASDTDADGFTFIQELANNTSPVYPDEVANGEILNFDSGLLEVNAQPYEQMRGAIIGGSFTEMFDSPIAGNQATSQKFGTNLVPYVFDLNSDGLFDIVLVSSAGIRIYRNVGEIGNPEFVEDNGLSTAGVDFGSTNMSRIAAWNLNTQSTLAVTWVVGDVDLDGFSDLLISDEVGHIWYYRNVSAVKELSHANFVLQHKVWAGTYQGFANRLAIAIVDWESDGDLDCLAGTAGGKLMLLRNPKVGRPTNVRVLSGIDNVLLTWDPNAQSRIRGYRVYRSAADANAYRNITDPYTPLPTYRDYPPSMSDFDYKVSSVSRHYVAGNSEPIVSESLATEAVRASLGKVSLHWTDVATKQGEQLKLMLSVDNSMNLSPKGMTIDLEYDHTVLNLLKTIPSGLFDGDKIAPGGGKLYEYLFDVVVGDDVFASQESVTTEVSVKSATMYATGGAVVGVALPEKDAIISITARSEPAPYQLGDVNGDGKIDKDDLRELAKLKNAAGRKGTANQLKAGDFNGNGLLDNADYQALRALLKERGLL